MKWTTFIRQLSQHHRVTLIGPLLTAPHQPTGPTIYIDGGSRWRPAETDSNLTIAVGDGDSSRKTLDKLLPAEKDYSDLAFVLRELPEPIVEVELHGFLGGRPDHQLANLGEVHQFLKHRTHATRVNFCNSDQLQISAFSKMRLSLQIHGSFSVFTFETTSVQITGDAKYRLHQPTALAPAASLGLSNEGYGWVHISSEGPVFVFLNPMTHATMSL